MVTSYPTTLHIPAKLLISDPLTVTTRSVFCVLYVIVIIIALFANGTVIIVIVANKSMRSVTNICFVSLATTDSVIAAWNMPVSLAHLMSVEWLLGEKMCRLVSYLQGVAIACSILTLVAMSVDRYYAIFRPVRVRRTHTLRRALRILVIVWIISFLVVIPQIFLQNLQAKISIIPNLVSPIRIVYTCSELIEDEQFLYIYTYLIFFGLYILPILAMFVTYARIGHRLWIRAPVGDILANPQLHYRHVYHKKRVVRMLITIVAVFTVCWMPYFSLHIYMISFRGVVNRITVATMQLWGYLNCALNPLVYATMSENFHINLYNTNLCCMYNRKATRQAPINLSQESHM